MLETRSGFFFQKLASTKYMTICRVICQLLILFAIFPELPAWGQIYLYVLGPAFILSNYYLIWKEKLCLTFQKHLFILAETLLIMVLYPFVSYGAFSGLFMVQLVTVSLFFNRVWERNLYSLLYLFLGVFFFYFHASDTGELGRVWLNFLFTYIFFYFSANAIRMLEVQKGELVLLNRKLEDYSVKVQDLAVTEERNRLAREIHDTVAHRATGLIMQLQAAKSLSLKKPEQVGEVLDQCLDVSRSMLDEMRRSVHALVPAEAENLLSVSSLEGMINTFSEQTQMRIEMKQVGRQRVFNQQVQVVIYRAIQEALTNAKRHGNAQNVKIIIHYLQDRLQVVVEDNGEGNDTIQYGFGLTGMKERLSKLKGRIRIESSRRGMFRLNIEVPYSASGGDSYD